MFNENGQYAYLDSKLRGWSIYFSLCFHGQSNQLITSAIPSTKCMGFWFNSRDRNTIKIKTFSNTDQKTFIPPSSGLENDWLLVAESKKYGIPRIRKHK
jgi:hypothetical protein